jgi:hypothetical protein
MAIIDVPENHAAIILAEDGTINVVLPNYDSDDEMVSWKDLLITAISARMLDEKWASAQVEWLEKKVEQERRKSAKGHDGKKHSSKKEDEDAS